MKKKHLYVIPTNRNCENIIHNLSTEIKKREREIDDDIYLLLLDQSDNKIAELNKKVLTEVSSDFLKTQVYHIPSVHIDNLCNTFLEKQHSSDKFDYNDLFCQKYSYGITYNRIFLIAAGLGAEYIHRRDSDVRIQEIEGNIISPFEVETDFLGKEVCEAKLLLQNKYKYNFDNIMYKELNDNHLIYMVGGAYKGNWPIDYKDLLNVDVELLYDLIHQGRPEVSREDVIAFVHKKLIFGCSENYVKDSFELPSIDMIEVGNHSIYKIFKSIPIPPAIQTSGLDYFHSFMLEGLGFPILYHNRRVLHGYTDERKDKKWSEKYYIGLAMYRCSSFFYKQVINQIRAKRDDFFSFKNKTFKNKMLSELLFQISKNEMRQEQTHMLNEMANNYNKTGIETYKKFAQYILRNKDMFITKTAKDVYDHGYLVKVWDRLIEYFEISGKQIFNDYLINQKCYC